MLLCVFDTAAESGVLLRHMFVFVVVVVFRCCSCCFLTLYLPAIGGPNATDLLMREDKNTKDPADNEIKHAAMTYKMMIEGHNMFLLIE